jgi:hypothetical protein
MENVPASKELDFPIPTLGKVFDGVKTVVVSRDIPKQRFHWIDF